MKNHATILCTFQKLKCAYNRIAYYAHYKCDYKYRALIKVRFNVKSFWCLRGTYYYYSSVHNK